MSSYRLAPHAFVCVLNGHAILMDLKNDDYIGVRDSLTLHRLVEGWPAAQDLSSEKGGDLNAINDLVSAGLLRTKDSSGERANPTSHAPPSKDCANEWLSAKGEVRLGDVGRFLVAYIRTLMWWRRPLETRIRSLRGRVTWGRALETQPDLDTVRVLTGVFQRLRPWFYTANEECLFDSFMLINFLSMYECFPLLVFAVATRPFKAHAWVQWGDYALNEVDARARRYSAILIV